MNGLDWAVLISTIAAIVGYGAWSTRRQSSLDSFIKGDSEANWWTIGFSVMATQASAITFLSTPGQGFSDGLKFVQFYFGLPLAMLVIGLYFVPLYYKLNVYTAYEFLEKRFDLKTRTLTSFLFLVQRGLAAGITLYAPAIILSTILGWNLRWTCLMTGVLVIIYTVSGGTKAVNRTQKIQMMIMMAGMVLAFVSVMRLLPDNVGFVDGWKIASIPGRTQIIDTSFDLQNRYTLWTGLIGGFFLALSYFGTDQSQVQRYLSGSSVRESRLGLLFNAIFKIPMQFFILLVGVMVFVFYQYSPAPLFYHEEALEKLESTTYQTDLEALQQEYSDHQTKRFELLKQLETDHSEVTVNAYLDNLEEDQNIRNQTKELLEAADPTIETNDRDYVFLHFILHHIPHGIIGLLLAMIFSAAMSSSASEINALASTTTVDLYKRHFRPNLQDGQYVSATRWFTLMWGGFAILFAVNGSLLENLIQYVNIIGSLFYGTILGVFLVAFFGKWIKGSAVFWAALVAETIVLILYNTVDIGYLWFNLIGCGAVWIVGSIMQMLFSKK